jgi:hypothetical protein
MLEGRFAPIGWRFYEEAEWDAWEFAAKATGVSMGEAAVLMKRVRETPSIASV